MIKILNPHSHSHSHSHNTTTLRTAEIMSKYRPIAPKPETCPNDDDPTSSMSQKISQSPYLRNLWPQMQARPTRTRKRGRSGMMTSPPFGLKRPRTGVMTSSPSAKNISFQHFPHVLPIGCDLESVGRSSSLVTLPLLPCSTSSVSGVSGHAFKCMEPKIEETGLIDLNRALEAPEEKDFLQQLQGTMDSIKVIAPRPVRPVGSSISVGSITEDPGFVPTTQNPKKPEEVEEEVESESLPVVISDSKNRVRLVNSAYKEMVGQPECSWLDSTVNGRIGGRRICGEVILRLSESKVPVSSNGFSCWVRIEWGRSDKKCVDAFCDVMRLACKSKDYVFTWRFHTNVGETCRSSCKV